MVLTALSTFHFVSSETAYLGRCRIYSDGGVWNTGDGQFVYFSGLKYENGKIEEMSTDGFAGSDVYDDGEFVSSLGKSGIGAQWENLNELSFLKATQGARLFKIVVTTTDTVYKPNEWMPYLMHRHVDFFGHSTLTEVEEEADRIAHENYIFPDSSTRYLTEEDLMGKSNEELRIGRNEIVARHGRKFQDKELQKYFDSKSWYFGYCEPDSFNNEYMLNEIEKKNMDHLIDTLQILESHERVCYQTLLHFYAQNEDLLYKESYRFTPSAETSIPPCNYCAVSRKIILCS